MLVKYRIMLGFIFFSLMTLSAAAMDFACEHGSGNIIKNAREVDKFDKIVLNGSGNIFLKQGNTQQVEVETDDNIMEFITTTVKGSTLIISSSKPICPEKQNYYITVTDFEGVKIKGSGDLLGENTIKGDKMAFRVYGSGDVKVDVETDYLNTEITGSGDIFLSGIAKQSKLEIMGSGDMKMDDLEINDANVVIKGSGDCKLRVVENLKVEIFGSGDVQYYGNPQLSTSVKGSGDIKNIGN